MKKAVIYLIAILLLCGCKAIRKEPSDKNGVLKNTYDAFAASL